MPHKGKGKGKGGGSSGRATSNNININLGGMQPLWKRATEGCDGVGIASLRGSVQLDSGGLACSTWHTNPSWVAAGIAIVTAPLFVQSRMGGF